MEQELWTVVSHLWVLETQPVFSERTEHALNHSAISPFRDRSLVAFSGLRVI